MANEVRVVVKADTGGARQEIRDLGEEIKGGLFSASNAAKTALLGLGAAGVGGFAMAVKTAMDFEHAMDQVGAVAGATKDEMSGLINEAKKIGAETMFSASQAAGAMEVLAANGIATRDIMGGAARAAADLAAAGGTDLVTAANIASTAMSVWELRTSDLTDVVNRLAGAANVSRFGVEDLGLAIAQGGGVAAAAGVSFQDFSAAIAATAQYFASGADAGTSFKTFLTALSGNSEKAKATMEELGLSFYNAQGQLKPMKEIVQELHDKLGGLSEQQQTVALKTIFGNDAYRTAAGLMRMTGEEFEALSNKMRDTDASEVARQRMGNLKGQVEELKGSLETMAIGIGGMVVPALTDVAGGATQVVNVLSGLPSSTQALALGMGALTIAIGPATKATMALVDAFKALRAGTLTLSAGLTGVTAGIGALALGLDLLLQKTSGHGLMDWLFGDVAGQKRAAEAMKEIETRLRAAGEDANQFAVVMGLLTEKTKAFEQAQKAATDVMEKGLPAWQQPSKAARELGIEMETLKESVAATGRWMRQQGVDALVLADVYRQLPPELQKVFDAETNIVAVMQQHEFINRSLASSNDLLIQRYKDMQDATREAAWLTTSSTPTYQDLGAAFVEAAGGADRLDSALKKLADRFAASNPEYQALGFQLAVLKEQYDDLAARKESLTAAEKAYMATLEAQIEAIEAQRKGYESNAEAIKGMQQWLVKAMGAEGYAGLLEAMQKTGRTQEEQIDILRRVGEAYRALTDGDAKRFRELLDLLRDDLTPEEWYQLAIRSGTAIGDGIADGIYSQMQPTREAGEALLDAALASEQTAQWRGQAVGQAIGEGVAQGMSSPSVASKIQQAANNIMGLVKSALGISSPSKVARDEVGKPIGQGIAVGIIDEMRAAMARISSELTANLEKGVELSREDIMAIFEQLSRAAGAVMDDTLRMSIQQAIHNMQVELEQGLGVANAAIINLAGQIKGQLDPLGSDKSTVSLVSERMLKLADKLLTNLDKGKVMSDADIEAMFGDLSKAIAAVGNDALRVSLGQRLHELQVGFYQGNGVSNWAAAQLARDIAAAMTAPSGGWGTPGATGPVMPEGLTPAGEYDWRMNGGKPPRGAHGVEMVWDPVLKAWVEPWNLGAFGTPQQWANTVSNAGWWSGPPQVTVQIDSVYASSPEAAASVGRGLAFGMLGAGITL
jgi:TP901 family phage tail tape measure protein